MGADHQLATGCWDELANGSAQRPQPMSRLDTGAYQHGTGCWAVLGNRAADTKADPAAVGHLVGANTTQPGAETTRP